MTFEHLLSRADSPPNTIFESPERRTAANHERELTKHRYTEIRLRKALSREEALLRQKDKLIQQQEVLRKESDHRLLNGLQMIVSLLSLQSREPGVVECRGRFTIGCRARSRGHDWARPPAPPLFGWRTNRRVQAIPRGSLSRFLRDVVLGGAPGPVHRRRGN
jgi:hypothetical protein